MRTLFIILAFIISATVAQADQPTYSPETKTFTTEKKSSDIPTEYTWVDSKGNSYQIYLHQYTKGENQGQWTCFVYRISQKTGNTYKYYLPEGKSMAIQIMAEMGLPENS